MSEHDKAGTRSRVLICGGRDWKDRERNDNILDRLHAHYGFAVVLHGAADGADTLAGEWAEQKRIPVESYPADWYPERLNGKRDHRAGFTRNGVMLREGRPDLVIAMPGGTGTADMMRRARQVRVPVIDIRAMMSEKTGATTEAS